MHDIPINGWIDVWTKCAQCSGTGKLADADCPDCKGLGKKAVPLTISALTSHIQRQTLDNLGRDMRR